MKQVCYILKSLENCEVEFQEQQSLAEQLRIK